MRGGRNGIHTIHPNTPLGSGFRVQGSGQPRTPNPEPRTFFSAGQTAVEFALLIAVLIAALLAMQIYMKRGVSGMLRRSADAIGEQYAPKDATSNLTLTAASDTVTRSVLHLDQSVGTETADVMVTDTTINQDRTTRTGSENVGPMGTDLWN